MTSKSYKAAWSRIGNSSGFRVEGSFFRDNPQFAETSGEIQVINVDTLLVRFQPNEIEQQEKDELMLSLFLDFLTENALRNPDELESYTEAMAAEDDELMVGVVLDSDP